MYLKRSSTQNGVPENSVGEIFQVIRLKWSGDPDPVHHAPDARHPAHRFFDGTTFLGFPYAAVQRDDELARADVRSWEATRLYISS